MEFRAHDILQHARGNWGLWDQAEALKWTKANIQAFHGNSVSSQIVKRGSETGKKELRGRERSGTDRNTHLLNGMGIERGEPTA